MFAALLFVTTVISLGLFTPCVVAADINLPLIENDDVYTQIIYTGMAGSGWITKAGNFVIGGKTIDTNVRSVHGDRDCILYIKTDNTLWGFGKNNKGQLGDGTGVDRDKPVKIMDNVAIIGFHSNNAPDAIPYAIKTDRTYWVWGAQNKILYEPVQMADNVVKVIYNKGSGIVQKADGSIECINDRRNNLLPDKPVRDLVITDTTSESTLYYLDNSDVLWKRSFNNPYTRENSVEEKIAENVDKIFTLRQNVGSGRNLFYLNKQKELFACGVNNEGQLGDGTKISRELPVKIADDVIDVGNYAFIKSNGELWTWLPKDPTPAKSLNGAVMFIERDRRDYFIIKDGSVHTYSSYHSKFIKVADNVKIPKPNIYP